MKEHTWNRCRGMVSSGSHQQAQLDKHEMELVPSKKWLRSPKVDHNLGSKILGWMEATSTGRGAE